jgi:hypothetical protein
MLTANSVAGPYNVQVQAGGASTTMALTNTNGLPASITITSGNNQATVVGHPFPAPLTVTVADASGQPYPGTTVTFSAPATGKSGTFVGSGSDVTTAETNQSGVATVPVAYAGSVSGTYIVSVTANSAKTNLTLTNLAGPASKVTVSAAANNQSQTIGNHFPVNLSATVTDSLGNPVSNDGVTFSAPTSGSSGTFAGSGASVTVTTNENGIATAPVFTANLTVGSYSVSIAAASTSGTPPSGSYTLTNTSSTSSPAVTSISPASGTAAGGTTVTITGTGFTGATVVKFGSSTATFTVNSNTSITATSASGTGVVDVTVTTPGGTSQAVTGDHFTYTSSIPVVTSISPASGPPAGGTTVTVTGTGFTGATEVSFGPIAATSFSVVSDTKIVVVSPAQAASTRYVFVTTPGGKSAAGTSPTFTYT